LNKNPKIPLKSINPDLKDYYNFFHKSTQNTEDEEIKKNPLVVKKAYQIKTVVRPITPPAPTLAPNKPVVVVSQSAPRQPAPLPSLATNKNVIG
jgi:hypothetical protein